MIMSRFVCHDLLSEHSMALTRPVQCLPACTRSSARPPQIALSLQLSFFLFLPRRRNVHQTPVSSNGKFAAAKSDFLFRLSDVRACDVRLN
jgi:hypothetical protein